MNPENSVVPKRLNYDVNEGTFGRDTRGARFAPCGALR
jgi:hypothetical protein